MTSFQIRRAFFDHYSETVNASPGKYGRRFTCPCCGYLTLGGRGAYEICFLCSWEDEGQDDDDADDESAANHGMTLNEARLNFHEHLVMYRPGHDPRIGGGDTAEELASKRRAVSAFEQLRVNSPEAHSELWGAIRAEERELYRLLKLAIARYESGG